MSDCPSDFAVNHLAKRRVFRNPFKQAVYLGNKITAKSGELFFIVSGRALKVALGLGPSLACQPGCRISQPRQNIIPNFLPALNIVRILFVLPQPRVKQLAMRLVERKFGRFVGYFIPQLQQEPNLFLAFQGAKALRNALSAHLILPSSSLG